MLERTSIPEAPWYIVEGNDKKAARLVYISHLLAHLPYEEVLSDPVELPDRVFNPDYERQMLPSELYVPRKYWRTSPGPLYKVRVFPLQHTSSWRRRFSSFATFS